MHLFESSFFLSCFNDDMSQFCECLSEKENKADTDVELRDSSLSSIVTSSESSASREDMEYISLFLVNCVESPIFSLDRTIDKHFSAHPRGSREWTKIFSPPKINLSPLHWQCLEFVSYLGGEIARCQDWQTCHLQRKQRAETESGRIRSEDWCSSSLRRCTVCGVLAQFILDCFQENVHWRRQTKHV